MCLGPDGARDLDGDGFPNRCDCDDGRGGVSPAAIDECDGVDNDCDGLVDVHTAFSLRGAEMISRLAQRSDFVGVGQRSLSALAGGAIVSVGPASVDAPPFDIYYREALALQPVIGGQRFVMTVERDTLAGDHDFIVGVSNGQRFFGVTIENDGVAGTSYLVSTFEGADVGAALAGTTIGAGVRISEAPPYTLDFRLDDGQPRIVFASDAGATATLSASDPAALNAFGDTLDAVLVADSTQERYRFRSLVVRQALSDADGDGFCDDIDLCTGGDDGGPDADADGIVDACDVCPLGDDRPDADADGVPDACDVCAGFDDNADADDDAIPDGCDDCPDDFANDNDGDGICDLSDRCLDGDDTLDADGDGVPDACDRCPLDTANDDDEDGVCDSDDLCVGNDNAGDNDGDGFCGDVDCDDSRAHIHPGAEEVCDGFDSDCNGALRGDELDADGDGVIECLAPAEAVIVPEASGCTQGGGGNAAALVALLAGLTRLRRRRHRCPVA